MRLFHFHGFVANSPNVRLSPSAYKKTLIGSDEQLGKEYRWGIFTVGTKGGLIGQQLDRLSIFLPGYKACPFR